MSLTRRFLLSRLFPGIAGTAAAAALPAVAQAAGTTDTLQKVVYHLSEPSRVNFVLGNIKNHIAGKGGPDKVKIVLVIHGPALSQFAMSKASPDIERQVTGYAKDGVNFVACGNTMQAQKLSVTDMMSGFEVAPEGGVVRIADLQQQGYAYIRP